MIKAKTPSGREVYIVQFVTMAGGLFAVTIDKTGNICDLPAEQLTVIEPWKQIEWISVDERLPEKEQIVLCCLGLVMNVYTYKGDGIWEDSYGYWQKDEPITHWMPLPEPPKGE